ncbi:CoA-acylating methylmalonate-semialdehyde dehydrogenase [Anaeromyxobacter dehalogenans]|uniref:methylmalonate-semialdehyde dehydrogenase (CoA acylating) n=1 Tax=Anaeromyxobacter dehalogenans (strain 2CP-C) TaxID=290397 RepID=Q2IK33_ANADE|nr:CoA-acylating methylmalonate-semialdehyde dehydrogenase [Anaeromyxobacter dehalogenans]ABC82015.1 methylmalonate-semialdehyde dehydrogenase (acylating) [Anaeromyxobacter dehalogenans 2CP-C]
MTAPLLDLWIAGRRTAPRSARTGDVFDPATGEVIRRVPLASAEDVAAAVAAARAAFPAWRDTPPLRRARVLARFRELLEANRDALAALVCEEHGKTLPDAAGSVQRGIEVVEFVCGAPHLLKGERAEDVGRGIDVHSSLQPLGVCAGITPFNFPAMVPLWMFPVAIACGNAFVLKPSEKVPSTSLRMAELFQEAGLPEGVLNVVPGDAEAVDALLAHPDVAAVSFVGSTPVARHVYETAARHGKRVQALGGAKNHAVVLPDADLGFTADALAGAAYGSAGERCMAISAVVAVGTAADPLVEALAERARRLPVGPGTAPGVEMGPVITAAHRDRIRGFIDAGVREGARLVVDGRAREVPGAGRGFFVGPTLFDHVTPEMSIHREEIFGPVLVVLRAASLDEALALVNRNPYGNGTAVFTRSGAAAQRYARDVEVGMVGVNVPIPVPMAFFSFGGWKASLFGDLHVHGPEGIAFYTRSKVVTSRWPAGADEGRGGFAMPTHA